MRAAWEIPNSVFVLIEDEQELFNTSFGKMHANYSDDHGLL